MSENKITDLLKVSMNSIREIIDVDIIIGQEIDIGYGSIIPVSKVKCGFVSGGFDQKQFKNSENPEYPFGGATGGNLQITPVAFLVCMNDDVKVLHLEETSHLVDRVADGALQIIEKVIKGFGKKSEVQVFPVEKS